MYRRAFLSRAGAATAGVAAAIRSESYARSSPNDTVNVAVVGIRGDNKGYPVWTGRGRGQEHYAALAGLQNVRITQVVDVDERHFSTTLPLLRDRLGGDPRTEVDIRRVLDNPEVDAITIAAPDHWHALMTIWACQAGKDVYVEKPVCHNIFEGRKMVEAARQYKRVVASGTQRRSSIMLQEAAGFVQEGGLGKVYMGKHYVFRARDPIGVKADGPVPPGVHYDLWLGPAPKRPFNELHFHYTWHWFWDYGDADLGNNGIHGLDVVRWIMNKQEHPVKIYCFGGLNESGDPTAQETPNVQHASYEYADGASIQCEVRGWYTEPAESGISIYGSKGWMKIGRDARVYFGRKNEPGPVFGANPQGRDSGDTTASHFQNFIDCVRSREWQKLNAEILEGHMSTSLCHLGNISYRLGRLLQFDGARERFVGDAEADALLGRTYRPPYVVPEKV